MNNKLTKLCLLTGCVLCATLTPTALANHRSGDFALPETIRIADFDGDGLQDLAVNVSGFDHIAILKGDGHAGGQQSCCCSALRMPPCETCTTVKSARQFFY